MISASANGQILKVFVTFGALVSVSLLKMASGMKFVERGIEQKIKEGVKNKWKWLWLDRYVLKQRVGDVIRKVEKTVTPNATVSAVLHVPNRQMSAKNTIVIE